MTHVSKQILLRSEEETKALGASLSEIVRRGDCILLKGQIGAGKSTLARAFIRARLGQETEVPSPTFTLVQAYDDAECEIWHTDLYRLGDPQEAVELGLIDAIGQHICLIEWPDILGDLTPKDALTIDMSVEENGHLAVLSGDGGWKNRIERLAF
ncbi:MAG: tRNA (adenosine(37)-N6)-threonylcarbamoyltransferase complex ATPase subunit type 1 TsaE [Octadecabacter sp.]|nr:tRNA (adenosine(37)-N6)-threonylcarbamoyltransferase complex ATPase subunit type 1 TsaE [Octadecabacter sp.]